MNYIQLIQRLKRESGRSGGSPAGVAVLAGDDINLGNWIADAWREVQRKRMDWAWMRKTVTAMLVNGTTGYSLADLDVDATPLARWQGQTEYYAPSVRNTAAGGQPWPLRWMPYEKFQAIYLLGTSTPGAPQAWSEGPDKKILIGPAPNTDDYELTADYWAAPTELALDDDTPDMPEQFHMLLVWRALLEVAGFDAAPEVEVRARRNLRMAWADLIDDQAPRVQLDDEPLA